jgi:hypothetical protein
VLSELKNRLRSGDVWVVGSRQFKDFDAYLLDFKRFAELRDQDGLSLDVVTDGNRYLNDRCKQLEQLLGTVDALAQRGELPDAAIAAENSKLRRSPTQYQRRRRASPNRYFRIRP